MAQDKPGSDYILRTFVVEDNAPDRFAVMAEFEKRGTVVLARVGEGDADFRTMRVLRETADVIAEELGACHLRGWHVANKTVDASCLLHIESKLKADESLSYEAVVVSGGRNKSMRFASGDPASDWLAALAYARRSYGTCMTSSTCDEFVRGCEDVCWDERGNIVRAAATATMQPA